MISNGEIYHLAFNLHHDYLKKGMQVPIVELRDYLKGLNKGEITKAELEEKGREWANQKAVK